MWQALRAAGLDIRASWIDANLDHDGGEPSVDAWARHWQTCIAEASSADIVLVLANADARETGSLTEMGAGLASGAQVFLVSPHDWSVKHHPRVRSFSTLADAVAAIVAADLGERERIHEGNGHARPRVVRSDTAGDRNETRL
jgi:hypothetical protein